MFVVFLVGCMTKQMSLDNLLHLFDIFTSCHTVSNVRTCISPHLYNDWLCNNLSSWSL